MTTGLKQKAMEVVERLNDAEVDAIRSRRPSVRASLACEGLVLTDEEEALLDEMEDEGLTQEQRDQRVLAFIRARTAAAA